MDVGALLEEKPESDIQIWLLLKCDTRAGNTALDLKRHLECRRAGIELFKDVINRCGIGKIKLTGIGRKRGLFHGVCKTCNCPPRIFLRDISACIQPCMIRIVPLHYAFQSP